MTQDIATPGLQPRPAITPSPERRDEMRRMAVEFETAFLAEMLRHSGLGKMPDHFNGGAGERGFSGMMVREYAGAIARSGQTGLSDALLRSLHTTH